MPTIPEEPEMEEFVNWEKAGPAVGGPAVDVDVDTILPAVGDFDQDDVGFFLENVDGDEFSFWALEHYAQTNLEMPDPLVPGTAEGDGSLPHWELPDSPCTNCQKGGYLCKRMREGSYKGYCTSCVALRCECSFGLSPAEGPEETATFPPNPWPTLGDHPNPIISSMMPHHSSSAPDLKSLTATSGGHRPVPKIGARFSRESVKTLKNWLSTHNRHPYPTEEEKESLQRVTGLNKTQITNWLANARRRGKIPVHRSTSPHVKNWSGAIDIPPRRGTPSPLGTPQRRGTPMESMNPLQRWANSPPEHEPASVTDIARAIGSESSARSSGLDSPYSLNYTDDGSGRSLFHGSSASSNGTSHSSGGSFASAYSHASRGSLGSFGSFGRGRRRRRRRTTPKRPEDGPTPLMAPLKTFQCTFCTETFRTKHDWQRHEKSLHLSLERWVCAPSGPATPNPDTKQVSCVFCGEANPDEAHVDSHNHSACQERSLADRTFYRKDHLRQHLKLVHNVKFVGWSMDSWKVVTPEIRSRCGFCGIVMDTWTIRVDHIAEHFKTGNTMADWKGDWGFDAPVLDMVENSIPPYLIHDERNSPLPYSASVPSPETPRNAYELLKSELVYFILNQRDAGRSPADAELQLEACRITFGSEVISKSPLSSTPSWLRDLVMSAGDIALQAQMSPIRSPADSRMAILKINGKDNIFEDCHLERQLREFVVDRRLLGLTAMDRELQVEACNIIGRMEESSGFPSDEVANFLLRLIYGSTTWLADFRQRAQLPRSEDLGVEGQRSKDPTTIDSTIHNYSRLETELAEYVRSQRAVGVEPDDASLQRQARIIIYEFDDGWNQTAADNIEWLAAFKNRHLMGGSTSPHTQSDQSPITLEALRSTPAFSTVATLPTTASPLTSFDPILSNGLLNSTGNTNVSTSIQTKSAPFFFNDMNCHRRLVRELTRYAKLTMSPNNPNRHIPTDEELQHQARWVEYDDDDPWNQTAADNAEWLQRFKRDVGILPTDDAPGLPAEELTGNVGGSGFAPQDAFPKAPNNFGAQIGLGDGTNLFEAPSSTANEFLQTFTTRYPAPATVFCSRELENGLIEFTQGELAAKGAFPADEALKQKAREILRAENTAADDEVLLGKFKEMMQVRAAGDQPGIQEQTIPELPMTDSELNDMVQDMDFDFGQDMDLGGGASLL